MNDYTIGAAHPLPPIHLCRLRDGEYEYLTGYDGDAVVIRECPKRESFFNGDWKNGRTICCEERERTQEVFTLCALLNFFTEEIQFFNDRGDNETVDKALSKFVAEHCCRPSNLLIQIEHYQEFYMTKESLLAETGGKHKLFKDYANNDTGKEFANHEAK